MVGIDDFSVLLAGVRPDEAPLARLLLAKVFIWALAARRISARLAALPLYRLPLPLHSAMVLFLDTAASGSTVGTLKQALLLQTCSLVRGTNRSRFVARPLTGPILAFSGPF